MRLITLGGSAAGPNPGQGCSGYLVESGPTRVILDLGPGTLLELRKHVDFRKIDAIVLSHLHFDHWLDVLALRLALAYNPVAPRRSIPVWLPPGGLAFFDRLAVAMASAAHAEDYFLVFSLREYEPDGVLSIGELDFHFQSTEHTAPCWAIRAANGYDGDLFYSADTGPAADLVRFASGSYVAIVEGTEREMPGESFEARGHLSPSEAGMLAREAGAGLLVLTHLWAENDPLRALEDAREAFGGLVELATPGMKLIWTTGRRFPD